MEIIQSIIEELVNDVCVNNLKNEMYYNNEFIFQYERQIKYLKNKNKNIEKEIYKTCNHNWVRDYEDMYSRYKICTKCKLANMPYVYN